MNFASRSTRRAAMGVAALALGAFAGQALAQADPTTPVVNGIGYDIESSGLYSTYLPVGSGGSVYNGFSSFGYVSATIAAVPAATSITGATLSLYNTATSGKYAPSAGTFGVYVLNDSINPGVGSMRFGGVAGGSNDSNVGTAALSTTTDTAASLGVANDSNPTPGGTFDSANLLGTFSVTAGLGAGYTAFSLSTVNSAAQSLLLSDLTSGGAEELVVVSLDNTGHVDWDGNFSGAFPTLSLDYAVAAVPAPAAIPATLGGAMLLGVCSVIRRRRIA